MQKNAVSLWMGTPITELSREELIDALEWCGNEIQSQSKEKQKWMKAADPIKYLMQED